MKIISRLPEQNWNQREPLVLFIQDEDAPANRIVSTGLPNGFESITFDNLKLVLGPRYDWFLNPWQALKQMDSFFKWCF